MKKLLTIIALTAVCISTASAQEFAIRKAIKEFVSNKAALEIRRNDTQGIDQLENGKESVWKIRSYSFKLPIKSKSMLDGIIDAYDIDCEREDINMATRTEGVGQIYSIRYSERMPAATLGSSAKGNNSFLMIVSGKEKADVNTICGVEWAEGMVESKDSKGAELVSGNIYIIERDPSYLSMPTRETGLGMFNDIGALSNSTAILNSLGKLNTDATASTGTELLTEFDKSVMANNDNLRRMNYYAEKFSEYMKSESFGSPIPSAISSPVKEIAEKGLDMEKDVAKKILDKMIADIPSQSPYLSNKNIGYIEECSRLLVELLKSLDTK